MPVQASTWSVGRWSNFSEETDPLRVKLMHEPVNVLMLLHLASEVGRLGLERRHWPRWVPQWKVGPGGSISTF